MHTDRLDDGRLPPHGIYATDIGPYLSFTSRWLNDRFPAEADIDRYHVQKLEHSVRRLLRAADLAHEKMGEHFSFKPITDY